MAEWSIAAVLKTVEGHTSGGSNPSLSANNKDKTAASQQLAAVLILYTYKNPYKLKLRSEKEKSITYGCFPQSYGPYDVREKTPILQENHKTGYSRNCSVVDKACYS